MQRRGKAVGRDGDVPHNVAANLLYHYHGARPVRSRSTDIILIVFVRCRDRTNTTRMILTLRLRTHHGAFLSHGNQRPSKVGLRRQHTQQGQLQAVQGRHGRGRETKQKHGGRFGSRKVSSRQGAKSSPPDMPGSAGKLRPLYNEIRFCVDRNKHSHRRRFENMSRW